MTSARTFEADTIGLLAARAFAGSDAASVLARFERSFYLNVGDTLVTIGDEGLHDGPLNIRTATRLGADLANVLDIETGQRWTLSPNRLSRSDGLAIDLTKAKRWRPEPSPANPDPVQMAEGLSHLRCLLHARELPEEGLIRLTLGSPPRTATERAAAPILKALTSDPAAAIQLLGLGPGLTPSGDDLLVGLLITLRHVGTRAAPDRSAQSLLTAAGGRTTPISQAHLQAAASGYGAAPLHPGGHRKRRPDGHVAANCESNVPTLQPSS